MKDLQRRDFIKMSALGAISPTVFAPDKTANKGQVNFVSDGLNVPVLSRRP
ncbi:hypothetical protein [Lacihabitans sp. LS3-19]|uniref:hypothetical protein n=1 Tax=Lacihabitans sp. LS3-19 TaxID=2487335 RepID=UPI0020CB83FB|nr:hypothetical protein [Lacihabitans sp. LS3-19]